MAGWLLTLQRNRTWLRPAGWATLILIWGTAAVLAFLDHNRSEEAWVSIAEDHIRQDLIRCVNSYLENPEDRPSFCEVCHLQYDSLGNLSSWTNNPFLPPLEKIQSLDRIRLEENILFLNQRNYHMVARKGNDQTDIWLTPLFYGYDIENTFLVPYFFLGRYADRFTVEDFRKAGPFSQGTGKYIRIFSPQGVLLVPTKGLPLSPLRKPVRTWVTVLFFLGLALFLVQTHHELNRRFNSLQSNLILLGMAAIFRALLFLFDFPNSYIQWSLFSPQVLGVHDIFAPSLGDLSLNVLLYGGIVWIVYRHGFRLFTNFHQRYISSPGIAWVYLAFASLLSAWVIKKHLGVFENTIDNSQVDMEFTNLFATEYYSFVLLLDIGIILFSLFLLFTLLFRPLVLQIVHANRPQIWLAGAGVALVIAALVMGDQHPGLIAVTATSLLIWLLALIRYPGARILKYDLVNYLLILFVSTTLTAFAALAASTIKNQREVSLMAERVLENRMEKATLGFERTKRDLKSREVQIDLARKYRELGPLGNGEYIFRISDYITWLGNAHLSKHFEVFEKRIFAYDENWNRIDGATNETPTLTPTPNGTDTLYQEANFLQKNLYQTANEDAAFDTYLAVFRIQPRPEADTLTIVLELSPNPYGVGSVSPLVLVGENTYTEDALFNRFDYAIYRDGILTNVSGNSIFPAEIPEENQEMDPIYQYEDGYVTRLESAPASMGGTTRTIAVRYPIRGLSQVFTTFSLVFYFFAISLVVLLIFPVLATRMLRRKDFLQALPIRTKIRIAIVFVSLMPILGIIAFLQPYIQNRFYEDAKTEIIAETQRVSKLLDNDITANFPVSDSAQASILTDSLLARLREPIPFDITVYDERGWQTGSTQPFLFSTGIYSRLLNHEAHRKFRESRDSHQIQEERIGRFSFYSGYQTILGKRGELKAFVQVAFLNKKEALNDQVVSLLAYLANIYLLAFLAVGIISVLVSNALTQPLSIIQQRLAATRLGVSNEPISSYKSKDEIGAIVEAYNEMVDKLGESEQALKATQRQLAWRQMARQVAHEIKNPLTPMKLSIQHLMRNWNSQSPNLETMFPKVMRTLLNQIESMVNIADSFSQFAKMPEAQKSELILQDIIHEVVDLYRDESQQVHWHLDIPAQPFEVLADKDQLSRSLGNIVKNALQAMESQEEAGNLYISFREQEQVAEIEITDTGSGIPEEIKGRIFEPNFSTKNSGMGMGLAIVKRTIEINGGAISFESESGIGTTFYIRIPASGTQLPVNEFGKPSSTSTQT